MPTMEQRHNGNQQQPNHPNNNRGDWSREETAEERALKRKERITIASLITLMLAVLSILFTLLHQQFAQEFAASATQPSPAPAQTISALPATESLDAESPPVEAGLLVSFLDVGQGDSILLRSPSGKTMLVDGGPEGSFPVIDEALMKWNIVGLDVVVASHLHADHIGGLIQVVDT